MFSSIINSVWSYIVAIGLTLAFLWRVWLAGNTAKENEYMKDSIEAVKRRNQVEKSVDELSDTDVDERLQQNKWFRK